MIKLIINYSYIKLNAMESFENNDYSEYPALSAFMIEKLYRDQNIKLLTSLITGTQIFHNEESWVQGKNSRPQIAINKFLKNFINNSDEELNTYEVANMNIILQSLKYVNPKIVSLFVFINNLKKPFINNQTLDNNSPLFNTLSKHFLFTEDYDLNDVDQSSGIKSIHKECNAMAKSQKVLYINTKYQENFEVPGLLQSQHDQASFFGMFGVLLNLKSTYAATKMAFKNQNEVLATQNKELLYDIPIMRKDQFPENDLNKPTEDLYEQERAKYWIKSVSPFIRGTCLCHTAMLQDRLPGCIPLSIRPNQKKYSGRHRFFVHEIDEALMNEFSNLKAINLKANIAKTNKLLQVAKLNTLQISENKKLPDKKSTAVNKKKTNLQSAEINKDNINLAKKKATNGNTKDPKSTNNNEKYQYALYIQLTHLLEQLAKLTFKNEAYYRAYIQYHCEYFLNIITDIESIKDTKRKELYNDILSKYINNETYHTAKKNMMFFKMEFNKLFPMFMSKLLSSQILCPLFLENSVIGYHIGNITLTNFFSGEYCKTDYREQITETIDALYSNVEGDSKENLEIDDDSDEIGSVSDDIGAVNIATGQYIFIKKEIDSLKDKHHCIIYLDDTCEIYSYLFNIYDSLVEWDLACAYYNFHEAPYYSISEYNNDTIAEIQNRLMEILDEDTEQCDEYQNMVEETHLLVYGTDSFQYKYHALTHYQNQILTDSNISYGLPIFCNCQIDIDKLFKVSHDTITERFNDITVSFLTECYAMDTFKHYTNPVPGMPLPTPDDGYSIALVNQDITLQTIDSLIEIADNIFEPNNNEELHVKLELKMDTQDVQQDEYINQMQREAITTLLPSLIYTRILLDMNYTANDMPWLQKHTDYIKHLNVVSCILQFLSQYNIFSDYHFMAFLDTPKSAIERYQFCKDMKQTITSVVLKVITLQKLTTQSVKKLEEMIKKLQPQSITKAKITSKNTFTAATGKTTNKNIQLNENGATSETKSNNSTVNTTKSYDNKEQTILNEGYSILMTLISELTQKLHNLTPSNYQYHNKEEMMFIHNDVQDQLESYINTFSENTDEESVLEEIKMYTTSHLEESKI